VRSQLSGILKQNGFSLNVFTSEELLELHNATLEVLEQVGINIFCENALEILDGAGAKVDRSTSMVKIPQYIVERAVRAAPRNILLAGRDPKHDLVLEDRRVSFANFGAGVQIVDPYTGELRESTKADVKNTALVCDALDSVDVYFSAVVAKDMPESTADLHEAESFLSGTSKHCQHFNLTGGSGARGFLEMGSAIAGGMENLRRRPVISAMVCPVSPLQLHTNTCEIIIEFATAGVPVNILSLAMSGASSPITPAGAIIVSNAEVLAGIVLAQAARKGSPVIYGSSTTTFDLTHVTAPVGSPELAIISSGVAELAGFYGLPSCTGGT